MILSMTGFGSGEAEADGAQVRVEVRSVNSRFLDVQVRCPARLRGFEAAVKERLQGRVARGKVTVGIELEEAEAGRGLPGLNEEVAQAYLSQLRRLQEVLGLEGTPDLALLAGLPGLFTTETAELDTDTLGQLLFGAVDEAVAGLEQMRAAEGRALAEDLTARVTQIEAVLRRVEQMVADRMDEARTRLREKVATLLEPGRVDEDRLATEIVLLAERSDIAEETVRLHSHNAQFVSALEKGGEVGRRLSFLLQEMNREANTICSKVGDSEAVHLVLEIKEEVERLREQVQNLA